MKLPDEGERCMEGVRSISAALQRAKRVGPIALAGLFLLATSVSTPAAADNLPPVWSNCPSSQILNGAPNSRQAFWTAPSASDNVGVTRTTATHNSGAIFPIGVTQVTYQAFDAANNSGTCSFTITVRDVLAPVWSNCPSSQILNGAPNSRQAFWTAPSASDNVGVTRTTATHNSGAIFSIGVTQVAYQAFDAANNGGTCGFTITVRDVTSPTITGRPTNIISGTDTGVATAVVTWTAPTASDNVGVTSFTSTHSPGGVFELGTTTVTYTALDAAGNAANAGFTVTVRDLEAPRLLDMPADITRHVPPGQTSAGVTWPEPTASDNVAVTSFTSTQSSGGDFALGTTTVTYTARDAAGNTSHASFTVSVIVGAEPTNSRQVPALGTLATLALAALLAALAMARVGTTRRL